MTDWELWACASKMREQFGNDAPIQAAMRADAMIEADDHAGQWVWCRILSRITKLGPVVDDGATRH